MLLLRRRRCFRTAACGRRVTKLTPYGPTAGRTPTSAPSFVYTARPSGGGGATAWSGPGATVWGANGNATTATNVPVGLGAAPSVMGAEGSQCSCAATVAAVVNTVVVMPMPRCSIERSGETKSPSLLRKDTPPATATYSAGRVGSPAMPSPAPSGYAAVESVATSDTGLAKPPPVDTER